jgi:hypothetical protein
MKKQISAKGLNALCHKPRDRDSGVLTRTAEMASQASQSPTERNSCACLVEIRSRLGLRINLHDWCRAEPYSRDVSQPTNELRRRIYAGERSARHTNKRGTYPEIGSPAQPSICLWLTETGIMAPGVHCCEIEERLRP